MTETNIPQEKVLRGTINDRFSECQDCEEIVSNRDVCPQDGDALCYDCLLARQRSLLWNGKIPIG